MKQWWTKKRIILTAVNIIMTCIIAVCGIIGLVATQGALMVYYLMLIFEVAFIICSLIVYYLSIIADAVGRMAKSAEEDKD